MKGLRIPLSVQNAEINTASVTINTLEISGKQVTLAVFRQLREHYPLTWEPEGYMSHATEIDWCGKPWGWVNYLCEPGCRNVVWQMGSSLYRGVLSPPGSWLKTEGAQAAYQQRWDELGRLPQLFIAV